MSRLQGGHGTHQRPLRSSEVTAPTRNHRVHQRPQGPPEAMAPTRNHRVEQRPQCPPQPTGSTRGHSTHQKSRHPPEITGSTKGHRVHQRSWHPPEIMSPQRLLFNIDKGEQEARLSCSGLRETAPTGCSLGSILLLRGPASPDSKAGVGRTQRQSQPWATDKLTDK